MDVATLDGELFARLAARIAAVSGIRVPPAKRWLLSSRVAERMQIAGYPDPRRYVDDVLSGAHEDELGRLVELVRVGETHFFRHERQLRALSRVALPEILARRAAEAQKTVRVWSAGCATGEEPYTLAMMLAGAIPEGGTLSWEVLATDLSESALALAAAARYPASAATGVPKAVAGWALRVDGDEVVVAETLRARVRFERRNLLEAAYPRGFDLVLCRNVLIYFDRATQADVVRRLARSVVPGGWLALGYAEHVHELDDAGLVPLRTEDGILYRRQTVADGPKAEEVARAARARARAPSPSARSAAKAASVRPASAAQRRRTTPPRGIPPALSGEVAGATGLALARAVIASLIAEDRAEAELDLRGLRFADEDVARMLARAAAAMAAEGRRLVVRVDGLGGERFVRRHGIAPPAVVATGEEPAP